MVEGKHIVCSDDRLLTQLAQDDKDAFDRIYNRYWEQLFSYVAKLLSDKDEAKDITQEAFVALWSHRLKLNNVESLKAYLFSIARYKALKYIKNNISKNNYLESLSLFFDLECDSVNQGMDANELNLLINNEVAKLPPKMREVFILSRKEQLSHKLISEKLMISDKTVKKQINNVLKHLRLKLADKMLFILILVYILL